MINLKTELEKVVKILATNGASLRDLAIISGRDIETFYNGADLTGIDLSGQDLCGMNFNEADLRRSDLADIIFDLGAFNGSMLDESAAGLKDRYEFFGRDVVDFPTSDLLLFCRFRENIVDKCLNELGYTFRSFSSAAGISENALRKARGGKVVAIETAKAIFEILMEELKSSDNAGLHSLRLAIYQPQIELLGGGNNSSFITVSRAELHDLLAIRRYRILKFGPTDPPYLTELRDTLEYLRIYEDGARAAGFIS